MIRYELESFAEHPGLLQGQEINVERLWLVVRGEEEADIYSEGPQDGVGTDAVADVTRSEEPLSRLPRSLENSVVMSRGVTRPRDLNG